MIASHIEYLYISREWGENVWNILEFLQLTKASVAPAKAEVGAVAKADKQGFFSYFLT